MPSFNRWESQTCKIFNFLSLSLHVNWAGYKMDTAGLLWGSEMPSVIDLEQSLVAHSIISQISSRLETRTQVPNSKSTLLSTTFPIFLRLSLWIGEMGELIQSPRNKCTAPISFALSPFPFFYLLNPGEWRW